MKTLRSWMFMFGFTIVMVTGNPVAQEVNNNANEIEESTPDNYMNSIAKCPSEGGATVLINCAALRTLKVLQRAARAESVELLPGVTFVSENQQIQRERKSLTDERLPDNPKQRAEKLINLIIDAAGKFIASRTLKIEIPKVTSMDVAIATEEGRGKLKKMSPLLLLLAAKALLLKKVLIIALGLISTKALVLSVIALVLAIFAGGSSILSGGGFNLKNFAPPVVGHGWLTGWAGGSGYGPSNGYGTNYNPGWTTNTLGGWGNSQYPYARSIDVKDNGNEFLVNPQDLAYSKQKP